MKKLMIALTAVAAGFFASPAVADEALPTGVGFETLTAGTELDPTADAHWAASTDTGAKMTITAWEGGFPTGITRPAVPGENDEVNYLDLKTALGNPLVRRAFTTGTPTVTDNKIFFDSMIKFTAFDADPDTTDYEGDSKLIVYIKDNSEDESVQINTTNLIVIAKNSDGENQAYDLGTIDIDVWHRLTIKAIKAFTGSEELAFTVYVDQKQRAATVAGFADDSALTTEAKGINAANRLFKSINTCTSIEAVGFDGQGYIDDLVFADTVEGTWVDEKAFAITKGENITQYTWTLKSAGTQVATGNATGNASIPAVDNMTVEISDVTFATGSWSLAAEDCVNCEFANSIFSNFGTGSASATLVANDNTPRVSVTIGETTTTYPSVGKAFAAINAVASGDIAVAINENMTLGTHTYETSVLTDGDLYTAANVTIDLAGKTLTGPADCTDYVIMRSVGSLKIVDTSVGQTGKILPVTGNAGAVNAYNCNLTIEGGIFDGAVVVEGTGTLTITGGKFLVKPDYTPVEGKSWKQDAQDYWYIADADRAEIVGGDSYATLGDAIAAAADGDTVKLLMNSEEGGKKFAIGNTKFPTAGLTIDLNGKTLTFNADAAASSGYTKDCITINTNNIVTITNGTLAVAASKNFRDIIRYYAHADYNQLNLIDVTFDCANLGTITDENMPIAPVQIEGGNVTFKNVAFNNVPAGGYTLKFGNHANATQYKMGTYTFDNATAEGLSGNVLIAGGTYVGAEGFASSDATFYYVKNAYSSWDDANVGPFAARYGTNLVSVAGAEDLVLGQLYFGADNALAAYNDDTVTANKELVVFGTLQLTDEQTFEIPVKALAFDVNDCDCYLATNGTIVTKTTGLASVIEPATAGEYEIKASEPVDGWITYTCEEKSTPAPKPAPGQPAEYDDDAKATAAAAAINNAATPEAKAALIADPITGISAENKAIYAGYVQAVASGNYVALELNAAGETALSNQVAAAIQAFDVAAVAGGTASTATIENPIVGMWYNMVHGTVLGAFTAGGTGIQADGSNTVSFEMSKTAEATAEFYTIRSGLTQSAVAPDVTK